MKKVIILLALLSLGFFVEATLSKKKQVSEKQTAQQEQVQVHH